MKKAVSCCVLRFSSSAYRFPWPPSGDGLKDRPPRLALDEFGSISVVVAEGVVAVGLTDRGELLVRFIM